MGVGPGEERSKGGAVGVVVALVVIAALIAGGAYLYFTKPGQGKAEAPAAAAAGSKAGDYAALAKGALTKLEVADKPSTLSDLKFNDAAGKPVDARSAFRGKVVVLNLWATWCAPCVTEMPTLAALQRAYPNGDVVVIPVSVDPADRIENARNFIGVNEPLPFYHTPNFGFVEDLGVKGMPATLIYDRNGREAARVLGESQWDSPEVKALIEKIAGR